MSNRDTLRALKGKTIDHCSVSLEDSFDSDSIYYRVNLMFTDGTMLEIEERSQTGEIRLWLLAQ